MAYASIICIAMLPAGSNRGGGDDDNMKNAAVCVCGVRSEIGLGAKVATPEKPA